MINDHNYRNKDDILSIEKKEESVIQTSELDVNIQRGISLCSRLKITPVFQA